MTAAPLAPFDPELDLVLKRTVDVPPRLVWAAWTEPDYLCKWFCPAPWSVSECQIDLRPGGLFRTVMRSPEGAAFPNVGAYLAVEPEKRLVWTNALLPGFRPAPAAAKNDHFDLLFTGQIEIEADGAGTRYTATAMHQNAKARQAHAEMGFEQGWSIALDQLVAFVKTL